MARVFLGLGSNVGDRAANIHRALAELRALMQVTLVSSLYESEPVGYRDQPWFLNAACQAETLLSPQGLLSVVKGIEQAMGRQQTVRFGPRLIDIDILLYGDLVLQSPELQLPHPRLAERAFVLRPLAEIAPDLRHPTLSLSIRELLDRLGHPSEVRRWEKGRGDTPAAG